VLGRSNAVFVATDRLWPKTESALSGAAAAGVKADVRVEQVADEISFDLQIALIYIRHPRQRIHVLDQLSFRVVPDFAVFVAVRQAGDGFQRPVFGDFLAREIEFFAPSPIDGRRGLEGFR